MHYKATFTLENVKRRRLKTHSEMRCMSTIEKEMKETWSFPEKEAESMPWEQPCVDTVGTYKIKE